MDARDNESSRSCNESSDAKRRRPVFKCLAIGLGCGAALVAGEFVIRILEYRRPIQPDDPRVVTVRQMYSVEPHREYLFGHHPNVRLQVELNGNSFTFVTNADGLREERDYTDLKRSVVFLGDSIVEGVGVSNAECLDSIFEARTGITALNFGRSSSATLDQLHWLRAKYRTNYQARMVVLGFCLNDFGQSRYRVRFDPATGRWPLHDYYPETKPATSASADRSSLMGMAKALAGKSRLFVRARKLFRRRPPSARPVARAGKPHRAETLGEEERRMTMKHLLLLRDYCDEIGARLAVVLFPSRSQLAHDYEAGERQQDFLIKSLAAEDVLCLDLDPLLREQMPDQAGRGWFFDEYHPDSDGHRAIGEWLAKKLPALEPSLRN